MARPAVVVEDPEVAELLARVHARLAGPPPAAWAEPSADAVAAVSCASRPVLLAGPGVLANVAGLHELAAAGSLGVLNTWGVKGVFDWRSRHHLATAGLQVDDYRLGGLGDADLIVACGVDPDESPDERWRLAPAVVVEPGALGPLAERCARPPAEIAIPPLRARLAEVTQRGWVSAATPMPPSLVTMHYGQLGALVAADAGVAGYWVARTFATTALGGVHVPATRVDGFAIACALAAKMRDPDRPVLAVVDGLTGMSRRVLDDAKRAGVRIPVEIWDPGGDTLSADAHRERLEGLMPKPDVVSIAADPTQLDEMIAAAGAVTAWTDPAQL